MTWPASVVATPRAFVMTAGSGGLERLGMSLYSDIATELTEVVANASDAGADDTKVCVDPEQHWNLRVPESLAARKKS